MTERLGKFHGMPAGSPLKGSSGQVYIEALSWITLIAIGAGLLSLLYKTEYASYRAALRNGTAWLARRNLLHGN